MFLFLILTQAAHSVEEFRTRLYDVLPPARFVSSLVSDNIAFGFVVVNAMLVAFGLWCWAVPVRSSWLSANALIWLWIVVELGNGTGHLIFAASRGGYFPGAATAPLLLLFAAWLAVLQLQRTAGSANTGATSA